MKLAEYRIKCGLTVVFLSNLTFAAERLDKPVSIAIDPQPLDRALSSWARQTGYSLLLPFAETVGEPIAGELTGTYTAQDALKILLANTDLQYEFVNRRTVAIHAANKLGADPDSGSLKRTDAENSEPVAKEDAPSRNAARGERGVPEVLVEGARTLDADIKRTNDDTQPYVVINRELIEQSGASNIDALLRSQLTMATGAASPALGTGGYGSTSKINLRGLGADETLILVDGRRVAGFGNSASPQQPDMNGIPLAAIERIEVLPATASGIHGGGATGGVVNVVLRRDYSGIEAVATYGNTFDSASAMRRFDFSSGFNLGNGNTNFLLSASWSDAAELQAEDRDFARRALEHISVANPTGFFVTANPPLGATTNIRSGTGDVLTLKSDGSSLGSTVTSVPYGYGGTSFDGGVALKENAGRYNLDLPDSAQGNSRGTGGRTSLLNAPTVKWLSGTIRRTFAPGVNGFLEVSTSENSGSFTRSPSLAAITLLPSALGNPFNQSVVVVTPALGITQRIESEIKARRAAGGLSVAFGDSWTFGFDYTWNRARSWNRSFGSFNNASARAAASAGTLGVFRDTNSFPVDLSPYLLAPTYVTPATNTLKDAVARVSWKTPLRLPGGSPVVSLILEHREELNSDQISVTEALRPGNIFRILFPSASQDVDSIYTEVLMPVIAREKAVVGLKALDLQFSLRHDRYRTDGVNQTLLDADFIPTTPVSRSENKVESTDPTWSVRYAPSSSIAVRASYGSGFLPPNVAQLVPLVPQPVSTSTLTDPLRNNEVLGPFNLISGGNPNLLAERSLSRSLGVILTPVAIPRLRVSVDWVSTHKKNNISLINLTQQGLNDLIQFAPERIVRETTAPNSTGRITEIDDSLVNLSRLEVKAYDFAIDYQHDSIRFGAIGFRVGATRLASLSVQQSEASPRTEYAGVGSAGSVGNAGDGGGLKWVANGSINWRYKNVTLNWASHFFDSYFFNPAHTIEADQGAASVPSQVYHDLFSSYRVPPMPGWISALSGAEIQFGVKNVFNKAPPVDVIGEGPGTGFSGYSYYGDPRLASYYLAFKMNFGNARSQEQ